MRTLFERINDTYNQMTQAGAVDRPFCKGKPITNPWVIMGLRSEETEDMVEPLYFSALEAEARGDQELAQRHFDSMQPLAVIAEGLAYASAGYQRIEGALIALQTEGLARPELVPTVVTVLGISEATTELYNVMVSILETVDRELMAKDPVYAASKLDTVRDLIDYGRAINATGFSAMAWVESVRLLRTARNAPTAVLVNSPAQGLVS